jgi:L-aminopeptidase/D-esterase-like protein
LGQLTDVPGIAVGHWTDTEAVTGCTVVLCPQGAVAGGEVRGSAPGTRETDLLRPMHLVQQVHAIVFSGGSAFGLDAASGVVRFLEERGHGFDTGSARVPIVPGAVLFDLNIGSSSVRPGPEQGYQACLAAGVEVEEGSVGAGTGATVGKVLGIERATKGGLGTSSLRLGDLIVAALAVVNSFGDVIDPHSGRVVAGPREGNRLLSTMELLRGGALQMPWSSTTLGVVATTARLSKEEANKMAQMAHSGLARTINPCYTMYDGDAIFALSTGREQADITVLGSLAAEVMAEAVLRAVGQARGLGGLPSAAELPGS